MRRPAPVRRAVRERGFVPVVVALAVGGLALVSCRAPIEESRPDGATRVRLDLLAESDVAAMAGSTGSLVFGEAATRPYLALGWGRDQEDSAGPNVWAFGDESWLELPLVADGALTAEVEAAALDFPEAPPQDVEVVLNGRSVDRFRAGPALERHRIRLPAEALRLGPNRLGFRFSWARRPADVLPGNPDPRRLSVRFTRLGFRGIAAAGPAPRTTPSGLELPPGSSASWSIRCGESSWIRAEVTAGSPRIEVLSTGEDEPLDARELAEGERWIAVPAPGGRTPGGRTPDGRICRVTLGAVGDAAVVSALEVRTDGAADDEELPPSDPAQDAEAIAETGPRPDVLLYVVDTLRADRLSVYGAPRPTSPRLEEFARDAIVFEEARVHSSWTRTSMTSLLTGRTPLAHGVIRRTDVLDRGVPVLAEILAAAGWETSAWVTNGNVAEAFGLDRGFDRFHYLNESLERREFHQLADEINAAVFPDLDSAGPLGDRAPRFRWLHATDPHAPYTPRSPWTEQLASGVDPERGRLEEVQPVFLGQTPAPADAEEAWTALYDAEIAATDEEFGRLLDRMREIGTYDDTLIVFTSDHGEEFADHGGWEHGKTLYDEQLHVPLIVKLPGNARAGTVRPDPVRQIDVLPTLLAALGLPVSEDLEGRSLLEGPAPTPQPMSAHVEIDRIQIEALVLDGWKFVVDRTPIETARRLQLYRLVDDPAETRNLWAERPIVAGWLAQELRRERLRAAVRSPGTSEEAELDPELRARLEALGYLQ